MRRRRRWLPSATRAYLAGLALGLVFLAFAGMLTLPPIASHGDFAEQWAAARVVLEGGDPYDTATWRADAARLADRASDAAAFVYPPYVTLALVPLATLPLPLAATLWVGASLALAALCVGALLRRYPPPNALVALGYGLAVFASAGSVLTIAQGQWDLLLLAAISWGAVALADGRRSAGIAAAIVAKPQIAPLALLGYVRAGEGRARRRFVIGAAIVLAAVALTLLRLDWWREWGAGLTGFQTAAPVRTATLGALVAPLGAVGALVVVIVIAVVVIVTLRSPSDAALPTWLAAGLAIAPYTQAYDHALLIAPIALATTGAGTRRMTFALTGLALLIVVDLAFAALTSAAGHDALSALVPLAIWGLVVFARRSTR